ncbi:hypothetical protein TWF703_000457 [Orbilia oligospora]|uniref:Protein kinase domain-containing protein n=1 Tax=Orbilia oligospora TaxID=2813651 RepID=A0A7C8NPJ0_ORBOL|nr:hypothetical protein TWF703_000457 [Orbilia oligospora]
MTTVEEALALTLPKILHRYGTRHSASLQKDFIDRRLIYYWKGFEVDVMQSLEKSDLTGELNFINPEREVILVGNEHGLTGRFQENVGTLLGRAFDTSADSKINRLRFGDSQVVPSGGGEADVLIMIHPLSESDGITCKYDSEEDEEEDPSSSSRNIRRKKRDAPEDEADDVDEGKTPQKQVLEKVALVTEPPSSLKEQPSDITSTLPTAATPQEMPAYQVEDVTVYSVFFGEGGISKHRFQIQNTVQQNPDKKKRVFIGLYNGTECIAKYFPAEDVERYTGERNNYRFLPFSRHLPKMLAFGDVMVSAELGRGHIIILTKEKGIPLDYQMIEEMSQEERDLIRQEVISAVSILRSIGARHGDPAPWNILWDRDSERVVMLDFENMRKEYKEVPADVGEVDRIIGSKLTS